jgi:hypothetical protein
MPSIPQIVALKEKYGSKNNINVRQLNLLRENFNYSIDSIKNSFSYAGQDNSILRFFESQATATLIMLYIDITNFSNKCAALTNSQLATFLDAYYDAVVPIIYAHGGEVEKIMGDGIIAIFGQPFLTDTIDVLFSKADKCAKDLILVLKGINKEVKIALHDGNVMYYKNKTLNYPEYTVIGKPLTELYRLESVATNNSISFYYAHAYENKEYSNSGTYCVNKYSRVICGSFTKSNLRQVKLEGVTLEFIRDLTCTYSTP